VLLVIDSVHLEILQIFAKNRVATEFDTIFLHNITVPLTFV